VLDRTGKWGREMPRMNEGLRIKRLETKRMDRSPRVLDQYVRKKSVALFHPADHGQRIDKSSRRPCPGASINYRFGKIQIFHCNSHRVSKPIQVAMEREKLRGILHHLDGELIVGGKYDDRQLSRLRFDCEVSPPVRPSLHM